jgi:hypothetical protein
VLHQCRFTRSYTPFLDQFPVLVEHALVSETIAQIQTNALLRFDCFL